MNENEKEKIKVALADIYMSREWGDLKYDDKEPKYNVISFTASFALPKSAGGVAEQQNEEKKE